MNERIKALAEQAQIGIFEDKSFGWSVIAGTNQHLEKFAELIVQECINIIKPTSHHEAFAPSYLGDVDGLDLLHGKVKQIKQHFGVEESSVDEQLRNRSTYFGNDI